MRTTIMVGRRKDYLDAIERFKIIDSQAEVWVNYIEFIVFHIRNAMQSVYEAEAVQVVKDREELSDGEKSAGGNNYFIHPKGSPYVCKIWISGSTIEFETLETRLHVMVVG